MTDIVISIVGECEWWKCASTWSGRVRNISSETLWQDQIPRQKTGSARGSWQVTPPEGTSGWRRLLKDTERAQTEWIAEDVDVFQACLPLPFHSLSLQQWFWISNSRRFKKQKHFGASILRIDPFPAHCYMQLMHSKDGFVTRLFFTAYKCVWLIL